ncbi:ZPR1 zinc finger domain-containing protein [Candidatus Woesearchaeota archaeon]|nr:ZPR1 zinc finger domain-containing protein [Candidatus Woesearchaeota archaeon]
MDELKNQKCPVCGKNKLTLREEDIDVPFFGKTFVFSMCCEECNFSKADVEAAEQKTPVKITFEINSEKDMSVRVIKSSNALVKIPQMKMSMEPGEASDGFVSNIEGLLHKFELVLEQQRDTAEEEDVKKQAKNLLKKLWKVKLGDQPLKIIIEDKSGNSAIISDKSKIEKWK